jgi:hypothetical protein
MKKMATLMPNASFRREPADYVPDDVPVVDGGRVVGFTTRNGLLKRSRGRIITWSAT